MINLANMYYDQTKNDLAEKYYLMAIENGNVCAMDALAYFYYDQENDELAEKYCLMAIEKDYEQSKEHLGYIYYQMHKYELAKEYLLMGNLKNTAFFLVNIYLFESNHEMADKYSSIVIENGNDKLIYEFACMFMIHGHNELAEKYCLLTIEKNKNNIQAIFDLAYIYKSKVQYDLAIKYYLMILEKEKDNIDISIDIILISIDNLVDIYLKQNKYDLAEEYNQIALEKGSKNARARFVEIYILQKKNELVKKYLIAILENDDTYSIQIIQINCGIYNMTKLLDECRTTMVEKGNYKYLAITSFYESKTQIEKYIYLLSLNSTDPIIVNLLEQLKTYRYVVGYNNKISKYTIIDTCTYCLEDNEKCIPADCGHSLCYTCYASRYPRCNICRTSGRLLKN